jgi:glycosyltransferase involved in cell wall biosynthesis
MRVLWVVPRFGRDIVGGAETLVRGLATHAPSDWAVEVATTCATDHMTWANELEPGKTVEENVIVHRFTVGPRNAACYEQLHSQIAAGTASYAQELEWLANSVWAPDLQEFLGSHGGEYDLIVFSPYLFGTTVWGAGARPERSVLMPCLHEEPYAYLETTMRLFRSVRGCFFNSEPERRLARRLYGIDGGFVVGMGFDRPSGPPQATFAKSRGIERFVLFAGRLEEGKRVDVAVDYAVRYAEGRPDAPKLVLMGTGPYRPPAAARRIVAEVGFVSEEERRAAYREALAVVNPSHLESLSLVLLEGWLEGTPALVAGGSEVLRYHCEQCGGGFVFDSFETFRDGLDQLTENAVLAEEMGKAGAAYVLDSYGWPAVRERLQAAFAEVAA